VALVAGAVVLGEPVTAWAVVGFALILAGCYFVTARRTGRRGNAAVPGRNEPEAEPRVAAASGRGPVT
jgi:drug/metabolite transporter (DMT)-like permease